MTESLVNINVSIQTLNLQQLSRRDYKITESFIANKLFNCYELNQVYSKHYYITGRANPISCAVGLR